MYTRELLSPPERIVRHGKPAFGTYVGFPAELDIRGVKLPFGGVPLPRVITNVRIKSSVLFLFSVGAYIGTVDFHDQKAFGYAEVVFWNRGTKRKFAYRVFMGPRRRFIPHNMRSGFCASFRKNRYIRISWDRDRDRISLIFNVKGDAARPGARAAFIAHFKDPALSEVLTVVPSPTRSRCSATYTATPSIHGSLTLGKTKAAPAVTMEDMDGHAMMMINRAYYNLYSRAEFVLAAGLVDGRHVSFQLFATQENQVDAEKVNANFIAVDGVCTPLPPVTITHPLGIGKKWVVQDFENMVDLTFVPGADHFRDMTFFVVHSQVHTVLGAFEGVIKTSDGADIVLRGFEGIAKNQMLRL